MKPRLYIHIGFPKTGSSTIQSFFNKNRLFLSKKGLYYPQPLGQALVGHEGHLSMSRALASSVGDCVTWQEYRQKYLDDLLRANCSLNLLSGETFIYGLPQDFSIFTEYFDVRFICFLTNIYDFLSSGQKQLIKEGGRFDLFSFLANFGNATLGSINKFIDFYGHSNFTFINYDKVSRNKRLIPAFLEVIGVENYPELNSVQRVNVTPNAIVLMFLYQLSFLPFTRKEWGMIRKEIIGMDYSKWNSFQASFLPKHLFEINTTVMDVINRQAELLNDTEWVTMTLQRGKELARMGTHELPSEIQHFIYKNLSDSARASIAHWWPKAAHAKASENVLPSLEKIDSAAFDQMVALRREFCIACNKVLQLSRKNDSLVKQSSVIKNTEKKQHVAHLNFISANPNILSPRILDFLVLFSQSARQAYDIRRSGLFDIGWYLERYPDVAEAGIDPVVHYVRFGAKEGRDPAPWFSTSAYLQANPDVAASGVNPFYHYIRYGYAEGRRSFDC